MKKLFVVTIEQEMVVVADTADEAEEIALKARRDDDSDPTTHASEMTYYPAGWEDDCIPFGDSEPTDPDRSVGKWIELGAAPKLKKENV